jgi:hypothetical protein
MTSFDLKRTLEQRSGKAQRCNLSPCEPDADLGCDELKALGGNQNTKRDRIYLAEQRYALSRRPPTSYFGAIAI